MGKKFHEARNIINPIVDPLKIRKLGTELGLLDRLVPVDKLTRREKECIDLLLKGKMAPDIGEALQIDKRTVFYYLDNVKDKLGCSSKTELIETLQIYKNLGLLS